MSFIIVLQRKGQTAERKLNIKQQQRLVCGFVACSCVVIFGFFGHKTTIFPEYFRCSWFSQVRLICNIHVFSIVLKLKNNNKLHQASAMPIRVCCKWMYPTFDSNLHVCILYKTVFSADCWNI